MSWAEAKWVVDQIVQKTGQVPNNMRAFTAYPMSKTSIGLKFLEPSDSYDSEGNIICTVGGVVIRMSDDHYPLNPTDGTLVVDNKEPGKYQNNPYEVGGLEEGKDYYFSAFPYSAQGIYNQSSDPANRATCAPAAGEQVTVNVTIDDPSGFTQAVIKCVDETDGQNTATYNVTPLNRTAKFVVAIGHSYHLEYGTADKYTASATKTDTKVAVAGATTTYDLSYTYYTSTIEVTYPVGAVVTCEKGETKYTAPDTTGSWTVKVHEPGEWTLKATQDDLSTEDTVTISKSGETQSCTLAFFTSTITITYPAGAVCTCEKGAKKYTAPNTTGTWTCSVHEAGVWKVKAVDDELTAEDTVTINATGEEKSVTLAFFSSTIHVTFPAGATLTCTKGEKVLNGDTSGDYTFTVHEAGNWTVKIEQNSQTASQEVTITATGESKEVTLSFVKVYGITRKVSSTSPEWTRTDEAVGKTATASVGTVAGSSDFDTCAPWSGIKRETVSSETMVKIPKFYYKRWIDGDDEHIQIADKPKDGFKVHPLFNHAGKESDCAYVGAYKTSNMNQSRTGAVPQASKTRNDFRTSAKSKGDGWSIIDIAAVSAISMLILVEFANNNVQQVIGRGYCDSNSAALKTGTCDSVTNLTGRPTGTDGKVDVVWRGLEGFWGNVWEWVDGINFKDGTYYVCNDQSKYADDTETGYTALSYKGQTNWSSSYITKLGLDTGENDHVLLPSEAGSGSESTGFCDACWLSAGWRVCRRGGAWYSGSAAGLSAVDLHSAASTSSTYFGSRLLYIPS